MVKIVVDKAIPFIRERFPKDAEILYVSGGEFTPELVSDADAIIIRTRTVCDSSLLKDSKVRLIATATIGTDHIDIPWCEKNGISVRNAPGCNAPGVAQYLFASIFRNGFDPDLHTLGLIGYGNVGHVVVDWARQMGIKFLVSDPPREERGDKEVEYVPMEYLLQKSDVITLHVPLIKDGRHPTLNLIGKDELEKIKKNALLVNSSRGGVVDEKALKPLLKEKRIKAIIDVWENEPFIDEELVKFASIATPHIAGYSEQGKMRATRMALEAVNEILEIPMNISGLECIPQKKMKITRKLIEDSYNPMSDSQKLNSEIRNFENLRNHYHYRQEPLFTS